jgi:hypothetical protein
MTKITFSIFLLFTFFSTFNSYAQLPAFPGAEGYGKYAVGGRGGQVIRVTNLNDSGAGSLRAAIDTAGARTVIFDVGGRINLQSTLTINNPFITIAGQHSVGDGITLSMEGTPNDVVLQVQTNDVIIRYLTLRRSEFEVSEQNSDNLVITNAHNVIIDHCSFSWASDENIAIYDYDGNNEANVYDITIQNSLIDTAWGGNDKGIIASGGVDRLTFYNLLFTSVGQRQPLIKNETGNYVTAATYFEIINTVTFEGKLHASFPNNIEESGTKHLNYINNLCIDSGFSRNMLYVSTAYPVSIFTEGNISPLRTSITSPVDWDEEWSVIQPGGGSSDVQNTLDTSYRVTTPKNTPIIADGVVLINAVNLFDSLKDHVGASLPTRDSEDARAINDVETQIATAPVTSGTFPILTSGTPFTDVDNDGMPDFWEILEFGNLVSNGLVDSDIDGYTDLEEYLNQTANGQIPDILAESVEVTPDAATLNVPETITLTTIFTPVNTSNQNGVWTSSDASIATVSSNGIVSSIAQGDVTINFLSNDGGFSDSAAIIVTNINIDLELLTVTPNTLTLDIGENFQANVDFVPSNATNQNGTWTSSNPSIATADGVGSIRGIQEGEAIISFTSSENPSLSGDILVTVEDVFFGTYEFYNADTDQLVQLIDGDSSFDLNIIGDQVNFRSIPEGGDDNVAVESVQVEWSGIASGQNTESAPLYAGMNNHNGFDFIPYTVIEGTYNFIVTYYSQDGASGDIVARDTFSLTFFIDESLSADAGEDISICEGESTTLVASGGTTYLWSTGATTGVIDVNPIETTTYSVTVSNDQGDEDTDEVVVTVNNVPVADAGEDQTICQGETTTLTATGGTSYLWNTGENTASIEVNPILETTYEVEVSSNNCLSTDNVTIFVNNAPDITVSDDIVIVVGETTTLAANGGDNYLWSTGETTAFINVTPASTTTYTVSSVGVNACSISDDVTVTVIPEVIASAGADTTICRDDNLTLNATGGGTYLWNTGETTAQLIVSPLLTTTYTVTVEDDFGYIDTASVTITVNETPDITVSEDIIIIDGDSTTLIASGGDNYQWNTGETTATILVTPTITTTYTVISTAVGGCADLEQVTVTVIPEVIANAGQDATICSGETLTLSASGGGTYLWNTGDTTANLSINPLLTTTYTVTVGDDYGFTDTDSVTITVNVTPDISVSEAIVIMDGDSTTLTAIGGDNYQWNTGETTASIIVSPNVTTTYSVSSIGIGGCEDAEQVTVTVIAELIANAGEDTAICSGDSITLSASGGLLYTWNTGDTGSQLVVSPTVTTIYSVTVEDSFGNFDSDSITITVNETPNIALSENSTIIEGGSTNLVVSGAETYLWNTGETSSSVTVSPSQTTTYTVIATSNSCSVQAQVTVTVEAAFVASAGQDERVCENDTDQVVLTANLGDSYVWNTGETTQSIAVSPTATSTYTVTVTQGPQEDADTVTVFVDPNPNVVILNGDSVEIMSGDFVTLSASGANSYEWGNGATQPNIAVSPPVTTTYQVRGFIGNCYDEKQITVNVIPEVIAEAGDDVTICLDEFTLLTASGGDEYAWSTGETTQTIEVSPSITTEYTVTVFNAIDFDEDTVMVQVDADCNEDLIDNDPQDFDFHIFPNPASNVVKIRLSGSDILTNFYLYDITGKLVHRVRISNESSSNTSITPIDIRSLESGVYFIKLVDINRELTKKLIVK